MAECAEKEANTSDNADSVGGKVKGETEDRVKLCGPCLEEETEVPATKFCIDCEEHLCDTCVQYHRKVKLTKTHELIDTGAGEQGFRKSDGHLDTFNCTIHQRVITHYCEKHDKLCCSKCIDGAHSICAEFIYNVKGTDTSINEKPEFKEFVEKMHKLTLVFKEIKQRTATNIEKGMENFEKDIETLREAMDKEVARIQTIESSCDSVLGDLKRWKDMVENRTHSAIDEESGSIFLIGKEPFGLKEITNNGEVEAVSLTTSIGSPGGIVLDTNGTFLVSSESEKSIKRVSLEGSVEDYITGLEFVPHGLGMDRVRRLLMDLLHDVSMDVNDATDRRNWGWQDPMFQCGHSTILVPPPATVSVIITPSSGRQRAK
ncbi:tripartite motif-containing protein 45-like [Mya arenaria]|uniref:tripartite motif-containing protein 45-like n=1 Tax=Mya arenaria TaxID=6604 RepID=UPI0022DF8E7E|nr:tripartite motif-containing protein 45-like [Mya arenaria]